MVLPRSGIGHFSEGGIARRSERKLGVADRTEAVTVAITRGLIHLD
jgi:hypothetical protein